MQTSRWLAGAALAPLLVLSACGSDEAAPEEAADAPAETTAAAPAEGASSEPSADGAAAGAGTPDVGCDEAAGKTVGYSVPIPDPNFEAITAIVEARLAEFDAELTVVNANFDPGKQISDIQTLLSQDVDVLVANPIDPNSTVALFDQAREQGVPIVAQETTVGGPFLTNVTADVETAAAEGAAILAELVGDGQVTAVTGPDFVQTLVRENTAFAEAAEQEGLDVVDSRVNQEITPDAARGIADAWKQTYGSDLAGVWTFNDTSAVGVASAVDDGFSPVIVSINGQPEAIPLIEDGVIAATFDLQQDRLAQAIAYAALAGLCGQEVPEEIVVPVVRIDADTLGDYRPLAERVDDPFDVTFEERDGRVFLANP